MNNRLLRQAAALWRDSSKVRKVTYIVGGFLLFVLVANLL